MAGDPRSQLPQGRLGGRSTVQTSDGQKFETDPKDATWKPDKPLVGPLASVGLSASVGRSTEYAREKYELAAWCTLPCQADEKDILETYEVAYSFIINELKRREEDVESRFFAGK